MANYKDPKSLVDRLRAFQRKYQANKRCADCPERGPTYVCLDYQIFVCQTCCGLHREFGHKIKSISFSEWTEAEVAKLEEGGNELARAKWLDRWHAEAFPEPDGSDVEALREFIRLKYVEKKWFRPHGKPQTAETAKAATAAAAPAAGYEATAAPAAPAAPAQAVDLLSDGDPAPAVAVQAPAAKAEVPDLLAGLDFGGQSQEEQPWTADFSNVSNFAPKAPMDLTAAGAGLIDLDFGTSPAKAAPAVPEVLDASALAPVEEPAVEPAPADALDDNVSLGEKLRQAVLSGSQDDLKRLFEQCSKAPPKKAVDANHLAAFSAFDDLLKPPEEVEAAVRPPEEPSLLQAGGLLDAPSTSAPRLPAQPEPERTQAASQSNGSGPDMFFIGDDPQEEAADAAAAALGGGAEPRLTPRRVEQLMANGVNAGSNLTPQQLERLSPQELLQIQAMISRALQARAPPQPVSSARGPAPAPWQATAYRPPGRMSSFDIAQKEPEQAAPFGELLDMFQKKNTLGPS